MASNDQWPPVSLGASSKVSSKAIGNKRHVKELQQQETLKKLNEMFDSTLEPAVILSVVQNCNWELQPSIEGLITLSETVEDPTVWNDSVSKVKSVETFENNVSWSKENLSRANEDGLWEEAAVSRGKTGGKVKRSGTKNRMTSFCGNIAKLKSSEVKMGRSGESSSSNMKSEAWIVSKTDPIFEGTKELGGQRVSQGDVADKLVEKKMPLFGNEGRTLNSLEMHGTRKTREKDWDHSEKRASPEELKDLSRKKNQKVARFDDKMKNMRKNESESLCGLKVEYRLNGMSSSDDDNEDEEREKKEGEEEEEDDADVVIEDETSDYKINLASAITSSVSQFLSSPTQTPPRGTKPDIHMISTASPPRTPQRSVHDATFARIKDAITRGDKILVLMRGLPGSGKTTLAKSLIATTLGENAAAASYVYSSDDFFVNLGGGGVYKFDPLKLSDAHTFNRSRVSKAMRNGRTPIIVDNTNIEAWEMRPYAVMAVQTGYTIEILEPNTPWARNPKQLAEKNTHNVTKAKISERALKYEIIPSGEKLLDIYGLKYSRINGGPSPPPPPPSPPCMPPHRDRVRSNWDNEEKKNYVLTSHDIESMQNIDETRYEASNVEPSSIETEHRGGRSGNDYSETNVPQKMSTYADKVFDDYLKELQDSDYESFQVVDGSATENRLTFEQSQASNEISRDTPSNDEYGGGGGDDGFDVVNDSNESQQILGAIGSERKFHHSTSTINCDESENEQVEQNNVLSQCWDFTLIREGCKLHSRHGHYVSPLKKNASREQVVVVAPKKIYPRVFDNEKIVEENRENSPKIEHINLNPECESILIKQISNENSNDEKKLDENILLKNWDIEIAIDPPDKTVVEDISNKWETNFAKDSGNNDIASSKSTMFDSILNLLKRPLSPPVTLTINCENASNSGNIGISSSVGNEEQRMDEPTSNEESANLINLDNMVDSTNGSSDQLGETSESRRENKNAMNLKIISTNPFRTEKMLTDNINSISWKESPFPIDVTKILTIPAVVENKRKIAKRDAETMTTLYDFNVAYVGGTSEPGYRELWGVNRSINADTPIVETIENQVSKIITFDKSSMTGETDILVAAEQEAAAAAAAAAAATAPDLSVEKEKDLTNRLDDLIEMFPHYPSEYLKTLYEQQCNCNFDWVVDVLLLADVPNLTIENYEKQSVGKLSKIEHEKLKQRSHSSSPKNRRNRAKDFRSFSLDCFKDLDEHARPSTDTATAYGDEDKIFELFYKKALAEDENFQVSMNVDPAEVVPSSLPIKAGGTYSDDDSSETMELDFGRDFINRLENTCGNPDFILPDEFKPVIKIKKSMVDELYGLWIESMDHQMKVLHARLDERMAKDEAMARAVDREESVKIKEPAVPNLEEIMNMEMALARYHNELKENIARETPNDMASRLTRQMLYELLPDIEKEMLSEILKAHGGNFKETCEIIESNIGRTISKSDSLKKQRSLLERVHEESNKNVDIQQESGSSPAMTPTTIVVNPETRMAGKAADRYRYNYEDSIARARNARLEAQVQASLRIENYNKAAEAYRKGQPQVAAYYSQMVKLHTENIKAAHANAADEFLAAQTFTLNGEDTLDLHNLFVREALEAVDIFLDYQLRKLNATTKRSAVFFVITGYGARSNNGLGRIKPAVTKKLINKNIRFTEANPGCLKVTLNRRNLAADTNIGV